MNQLRKIDWSFCAASLAEVRLYSYQASERVRLLLDGRGSEREATEKLELLRDAVDKALKASKPWTTSSASRIGCPTKERAERHNEVELLHTKIDEVNRLRAAIEIARDVFRRWGWADEADALDAALGDGA